MRLLLCTVLLKSLPSAQAHSHEEVEVEPWDGKFVAAHGKHKFKVGDEIIGVKEEWFQGKHGKVTELYHNKLTGKPMIKIQMAEEDLGITTGSEKDWKRIGDEAEDEACAKDGACAEDDGLEVLQQRRFEKGKAKVGGEHEFSVGDRIIGIHKGWFIEGKVGKVLKKWMHQSERFIEIEYEDGTGTTATAEKEWALYED